MVAPVDIFKHCDDEVYITTVLTHIFAGRGVALLSSRDDVVTGMLIGFIDQSIWEPNIRVLKEMAYWVKPEYRGSSAGYRLINKYVELAEDMIASGKIQSCTISKMINSPDLDYGKFGFKKVEETWAIGGI